MSARRARRVDRLTEGQPPREVDLAAPGSVRHSLLELGFVALLAELLFGLVGGLPAAGAGAVLLTVAGLAAGWYVAGAGARREGLGHRLRKPLMDSRAPGLGDWRWTVRQALEPEGDGRPLRSRLQRLYAARLSELYGLSLTADRGPVAELVGPELWPWIDPESAAPTATVPAPVLLALVERLESLRAVPGRSPAPSGDQRDPRPPDRPPAP
ncbi:hypothetical protein ACFP3U_17925 [Kitasatospora misakiensis]|uniref:Uncharacterized protein n=1 Tax=Kitasatospora misakiensis TaxID=67330 RepID=A0ABW0X515_9ACTN